MKMTREQVIEELEALIEGFNEVYEAVPICLGEAVRLLKAEQRPHGEWIRHIDDLYPVESTEECSICHEEQRITGNDDDFCPNCGADMRPKKEGEEE